MKQNRFLLSLSRTALLAVAAVGTFFGMSTALSSCGGGGETKDSQTITYGEFARGQKKIYLLGNPWMVMEGGATHIEGAPGAQGWYYSCDGTLAKDDGSCSFALTPGGSGDQPMSGSVTIDVGTMKIAFSTNTKYATFLGLSDVAQLNVGTNVVTLNFDNMTWSVQVTGTVKYSSVDEPKSLSAEVDPAPTGSFVIGR